MKSVSVKNEEEMKALAERLAEHIMPGTVIGLVGDLGAGKTTFVKHFVRKFGVKREVKSPTFILLQEFSTTGEAAVKQRVLRIWHADAYRIEDERELWKAGLAEAVADSVGVTLVEWADKVPSLKTMPTYREISIVFGRGGDRTVIME